jgi:hypothetical protein
MFRKYVLYLLVVFSSLINAQFEVNKHLAGPSLGFSFLGSAVQLGLNYEYGLNFNDIGINVPGKIGIGGIFRYWSYSENFFYGKWSYTDILIGAQGNYHFYINNQKLDPWVGLVLAADFGSVNWERTDGGPFVNYSEPSHGGFFIGAHAGLRFWLNNQWALSTRIGFGTLSYGALDIGVDYKF